jgi:glycosyltransferase 2 family protein
MTTPSTSTAIRFITTISGWRGILLVLGLVLAWLALRGLAWDEAWRQLTGIGPGAIFVLIVLNVAMLPLMTLRWWQLLKTLGSPVDLFTVCAHRLAASAVSYLTPGPHLGGEPLLVYLLNQQQKIPLITATISVALDRILELWASIAVLSFSLIVLNINDSGPFAGRWALLLTLFLLVVLAILLAALFTGGRPLSRLSSWLLLLCKNLHLPISEATGRFEKIIAEGEAMTESLLHQHRLPFMLANLYSVVHWFGVFAEFWLMAAFLGSPLSFCQLLAVMITARLAFLTPLPAGLGALESALPWVTAALGQGSVLGLSLCLLIRFRDIVFSLIGLGLAMKYLTYIDKNSSVTKNTG